MNILRKNQNGNVTIIVLVVILLILLGLIALKLTDKGTNGSKTQKQTSQTSGQKTEDDSSTDTSSNDAGLSSLQRNARNTVRKNDASRLASATLEYVSNNVGLLPTGFDKGYLTGGSSPSRVEFDHYDTTRVESGEHAAITKDEILLVTGASCGQNGVAIESTSRSAAVLFATEGDGGRWDGTCTDI